MSERTFDQFMSEVRNLLDGKAAKKHYSQSGPDADNPLYDFVRQLNGNHGHALGEVVYKCQRFAAMGNPEDIAKAAAWCYLIWKHHEE